MFLDVGGISDVFRAVPMKRSGLERRNQAPYARGRTKIRLSW